MKCCCDITINTRPFMGCGGNPISNERLDFWIKEAIKEKNYELAGECKKEIDRRNQTLKQ